MRLTVGNPFLCMERVTTRKVKKLMRICLFNKEIDVDTVSLSFNIKTSKNSIESLEYLYVN